MSTSIHEDDTARQLMKLQVRVEHLDEHVRRDTRSVARLTIISLMSPVLIAFGFGFYQMSSSNDFLERSKRVQEAEASAKQASEAFEAQASESRKRADELLTRSNDAMAALDAKVADLLKISEKSIRNSIESSLITVRQDLMSDAAQRLQGLDDIRRSITAEAEVARMGLAAEVARRREEIEEDMKKSREIAERIESIVNKHVFDRLGIIGDRLQALEGASADALCDKRQYSLIVSSGFNREQAKEAAGQKKLTVCGPGDREERVKERLSKELPGSGYARMTVRYAVETVRAAASDPAQVWKKCDAALVTPDDFKDIGYILAELASLSAVTAQPTLKCLPL